MKLRCYYAHPMATYGSTIETSDLKLLEDLGFDVLNPNNSEIQKGMDEYIMLYGRSMVMEYFKDIVSTCDVIAFRSLPSGDILSGVSAELQRAMEENIPIIELPCSLPSRMMDYPETKQYLIEAGFYKEHYE